MADNDDDAQGRAKGGFARADALPAGRRSEIAKKAAEARWAGAEDIPRALYTGEIKIGETAIPCAVLEDGTRLLTQAGFLSALGRSPKPKGQSQRVADGLPPFLNTVSLKPLITDEIVASTVPVIFRTESGSKAHGYRAELLPKVCNLFLAARDQGLLTAQQKEIAEQADILIRGLAEVGIVALVDEATGYQDVRRRAALQEILDAFLRKELAAWAKRFPDDFYKQIFRLRGWQWKGRQFNPPQVVGHYTNDIVYDRLAPGLREELEARMPRDDAGRRKGKLQQLLTDDVGHPALAQHLHGVIMLMKSCDSWTEFKSKLDRVSPRRGSTLELDFQGIDE